MSSLPKKGTIIINPKTQRPVKVGSRTWLKLVRDGLVEGQYSDPKEIYTVQEGDDEDELINQFKLVIDEVKPKIIFVFNAYVSDLLKRDVDFLKEAQIDDELGCHLYNDIPIVLANQLSGGATSIVYRDILIWNTKRILNKIKSKQ